MSFAFVFNFLCNIYEMTSFTPLIYLHYHIITSKIVHDMDIIVYFSENACIIFIFRIKLFIIGLKSFVGISLKGVPMESVLNVLSDMSERLRYNLDDYPLYINDGDLKEHGYSATCHWHPDLEFIYVEDGIMDYYVNGNIVRLHKGDGLFVNSLRLHYGFSKEHYDCDYLVIVIHPSVFTQNTKAGSSFYEHKFGVSNPDFIHLSPDIPWQKKIIDGIIAVHNEKQSIYENPIPAVISALKLIGTLGENIEDSVPAEIDNKDNFIFLTMISYIQNHYAEKILIDDLADAGHISRVKAYQIFDKYAHTSINNYLMSYRISKGAELLCDTNLSVSEIASMCGFQTPNYFASVFRKEKGTTPREFRQNMK